MTEVVEHPPQARRDRPAGIVVGDDLVVGADPGRLEPLPEVGGRGERVAPRADGGHEIAVEVEEDRTGEVAGVVGGATGARRAEHPAHVDEAQVGRTEPGMERFGRDERRAIGHGIGSMPRLVRERAARYPRRGPNSDGGIG